MYEVETPPPHDSDTPHRMLAGNTQTQHPFKCVRVYEYGTLEKSTDLTNLLVDDFIISMETNGGDASCLNGNN